MRKLLLIKSRLCQKEMELLPKRFRKPDARVLPVVKYGITEK